VNRAYAVCLLVFLIACGPDEQNTRGVRPVSQAAPQPRGEFVREQSAALFVGVREFAAAPALSGVRYTVDDAVDLAYTFALEHRVNLVDPGRVALALTGEPRKLVSQERLKKLRAAGAIVRTATLQDVVSLLDQQAGLAGRNGLLILGFASHGFSRDGIPYVLTSTSRHEDTVSSLSAAKVFDIASASRAQRSLIFIDACRDRSAGARGVRPQGPLAQYMKGAIGQVVFYAAAPGNVAYEDEVAKNGVFTKAVIAGLLECGPRTVRGLVTVEKLSRFVEDRVLRWVQNHRDRSALKATQVSMDADTKTMPLASCTPAIPPIDVTVIKNSLTAIGKDARKLWHRTLEGRITGAKVADIDVDGTNEVLAVIGSKVIAIDALEDELWTVDTKTPIRQFVIEHLFSRKKRQLVTLSASTVSVIDHDGSVLATHTYPHTLQQVRVDRPTSNHERKIIVTADGGRVFMLDPNGKPQAEVWSGLVSAPVTKLDIRDFNNDAFRDIELTTAKGRIWLDFNGQVIKSTGPHFQLLSPKKRPRSG
jgi:hypothetical protein